MGEVRSAVPVLVQYPVIAKTAAVPAEAGKQLVFFGASVNNRSGAANTVGIHFPMDNSRWKFGQWDDSGGASYTDDTTDAQDAGASDVTMFLANQADDGFVVQGLDKFGVIAIDVGTAEAGSPVYVADYWNGSAWSTLTTIIVPTGYTIAEHVIAFAPPTDWAALAAADTPVATDGLTTGYYAVKISASTAPTTSPLATQVWVSRLYDFREAADDNSVTNFTAEDTVRGIRLQGGESIAALFETAAAGNAISVRYSTKG